MSDNAGSLREPNRIRSAVGYSVVFRVLSQVAGAGAYVLLVRLLSEEDFGYYQLFQTVPAIVATVFSLGIANTLLRYLPEYYQGRQFGLARRLISWCLRLRLIVSTALVVTIYLAWEQFAPILKILELKEYFVLFGAIVITMFQSRILSTAISSFLLQKWSTGAEATTALIRVLGYATAIGTGLSLTHAFAIDLAANLVLYVVLRYAYNRHVPQPAAAEPARIPKPDRKRILRYALFYNFNDAGSLALMARADYLFLAGFMSPIAVGVYAFCTQLDLLVRKILPMGFFFGVVQPIMFSLKRESQIRRANEYFQFLVKVTFLVQLPIFTLIASVPEALISVVFGGKFIDYAMVLVAVFAFATITAAQEPIFLVAQFEEKAGIVLASKIFSIYNIVANIVLIPVFGIMGAVIATGTAIIFKNAFVWYFVRDVAAFSGLWRFFLLQSALWATCFLSIRWLTAGYSHLAALAAACIVVTAFALAASRLADLRSFEQDLIRRLAGPRFDRILRLAGIAQ